MNFTNETILKHVNCLVEEWANLFEEPPQELPVCFTINEAGMLCVNGIVLFFAQKFLPDSMSYEIDSLYLSSSDGDEYEIGIIWQFAGTPYLAYVKKCVTLF